MTLPESGRPSITIVMPALNEERRLEAALMTVLGTADSLAPAIPIEVVVVDDGSTDRTAAIAAAAAAADSRIRVLRNGRNMGLGASFRRGLAEARGAKIMIAPGDNDLPRATLATLLAHADDADVVMCYFPDHALRGFARRLLSGLYGLIYAVAFGVRVRYLNGPSLYPTDRLRGINLRSDRFSIIAEINVKLLRQGLSFTEIPGQRQTGLEGSTSLSWRNLREVMVMFVKLLWEVRIRHRRAYGREPTRRVQSQQFSAK